MAPHLSLVQRLPDRWRWRLLSALTDPVRAARAMGVVVGEDCRILSLAVSAEYDLISIGDRVTISSDVLFVTHDGAGWLVRDDEGHRHYWLARIAIGSVAPTVIRLPSTEAALGRGASSDEAAQILMKEIAPIDDVRSTAEYRRRVAANLLARFWNDTHRG